MTPSEAFLQAIIENPDDDALRLVFADWLEEQGQPERAEFIRVQCELARLGEDENRRHSLETRERALLREYAQEWAESLRCWGGPGEFNRGFVESITLRPQSFLDNADAIFRASPIRRVEFQTGMFQLPHPHLIHPSAAALMPAVASCRHVHRLIGISFWQNGIGDEGVCALATSRFLTRLCSLDLRNNELSDLGVQALALSPNFQALTVLNLASNQIGVAGARALAVSLHLNRLEFLDLSHNAIGDEGIQSLADSPTLRHVATLNLARSGLGTVGARVLAESPHLTAVKWLDVRDNSIGNKARQALRLRFGKGRCRF